jgi:GLPGLI family protein
MKLFNGLLFVFICVTLPGFAQQRVVAECTVTYQISLEENNLNKDVQNALQQSSKTVYIKGNDSRVDLNSPSLLQSIIYDKTNGSAVILREFGNNKFMTKLSSKEWRLANKQYDGMTMHLLNETKTILGYECKKAVLNLKDSSVFNIYYATAIAPSVREFEYQFKDVPGFVLEFDVKEQGSSIVKYKATKINLSPVQASKYDIPTSGYRLLN